MIRVMAFALLVEVVDVLDRTTRPGEPITAIPRFDCQTYIAGQRLGTDLAAHCQRTSPVHKHRLNLGIARQ